MSSLETRPPDAIDAEFIDKSLPAVRTDKLPAQRVTAEAMLADLHEWESFKAAAIPDYAWLEIPGVKGKYLPAEWAYKLAPATRVSWDIVSKDEFGDPGVRRRIVEFVTYETKRVKKQRKNKKSGEFYDTEEDVPDLTKPVISKALLYTAVIRATDCFGRYVDAEGSFRSDEGGKSDYNSAQQALTRARRRSTLILIGGVDADVIEETKKARRQSSDNKGVAARTQVKAQELMRRAATLGLCGADGASFVAWAKSVPGCEGLAPGGTLTIDQREAVLAVIVAKEDVADRGEVRAATAAPSAHAGNSDSGSTTAAAAGGGDKQPLSREAAEAAKPEQPMFFTPRAQAEEEDPFEGEDDETFADTDRARKRLFAMFRERDIAAHGTLEERKNARIQFADERGIYVKSYSELTPNDIRKLISALELIPPTIRA